MSGLAYRARRATGLSQRAFAALLDVHHLTVARWETGEREPTRAARTLLLLVASQPALCRALLAQRLTARSAPRRGAEQTRW